MEINGIAFCTTFMPMRNHLSFDQIFYTDFSNQLKAQTERLEVFLFLENKWEERKKEEKNKNK